MKLTTGLANFCLDSGLGSAFDGGTGIIEIRTGAAPATAGLSLTGTVLSTIPLPSDAFAAASAAAIAGNSLPWTDTNAAATGTGGYAVLRKSGDTAGADDTVRRALLTLTATGGGGEIQIATLSVVAADQVVVTSASLTQPTS